MDVDGFHDVALLDGENYVHAARDFAEDGVAGGALDLAGLELPVDVGVEVGRCVVGDEELRGIGIESAVGHGQDAGGIVLHVGMEGVIEFGGLLAFGVLSALDDEALDDAVPRRIGVEAVVGEVDEVFDIDAGDVVVEIGFDVALVGFDGHGVRRVGVVCATAATIAAACAEECDRGSTCN